MVRVTDTGWKVLAQATSRTDGYGMIFLGNQIEP